MFVFVFWLLCEFGCVFVCVSLMWCGFVVVVCVVLLVCDMTETHNMGLVVL